MVSRPPGDLGGRLAGRSGTASGYLGCLGSAICLSASWRQSMFRPATAPSLFEPGFGFGFGFRQQDFPDDQRALGDRQVPPDQVGRDLGGLLAGQ